MLVLSVDQARHGAWCIYEYETQKIVAYDSFAFDEKKYSFEQVAAGIAVLIQKLIEDYGIDATFIEEISVQRNIDVFKRLAWIQGALFSMFENNGYLYSVVQPGAWQTYCGCSARTKKEKEAELAGKPMEKRRTTKILSIEFVKNQFGVETDDDNLADAISIGWYAVNNIKLRKRAQEPTE